MPDSTPDPKGAKSKPAKPYEGFPLFAHAAGVWAKKIRGRLHYFGPWSDPEAALKKYQAERDDLHAGRVPREGKGDGLVVGDLLNRFLTTKANHHAAGELAKRSLDDYQGCCDRIAAQFGLRRRLDDIRNEDFEEFRNKMAKKMGPVSLGNEIQRIRVVFKYAFDTALLPQPMRFGPGFKRPSKKTLRQARAARGPRMFERDELLQIIEAASVQVRAMLLLGINCGFGNSDCGRLPKSALDLDRGWLNFPRPKTGIPRRCPLWPETVNAVRAAIATRPEAKEAANADLVFITKYGQQWTKDTPANPISAEIYKMLKAHKLNRPGLNFYALRHTFETIAGETRDQPAVDAIMGHARDDMASVYRERIGDDRLLAVSEHVRQWLFGEPAKMPKIGKTKKSDSVR